MDFEAPLDRLDILLDGRIRPAFTNAVVGGDYDLLGSDTAARTFALCRERVVVAPLLDV